MVLPRALQNQAHGTACRRETAAAVRGLWKDWQRSGSRSADGHPCVRTLEKSSNYPLKRHAYHSHTFPCICYTFKIYI